MIKSMQKELVRKMYDGYCEKCHRSTFMIETAPVNIKCQVCGYWHEEIDPDLVMCINCENIEYKRNIRELTLESD